MYSRLFVGITVALTVIGIISPLIVQAAEQTTDSNSPDSAANSSIEIIEVIGDNDYDSLNYQVLHRDDFVNSSQTLSDLLKSVNGIQIRQISGIGNPASVSIRGSTSKQVQLYIDGQLVNDSQFGGFDLNQIPTEHIESIEVSKNQALGTGSTPIGGVIRINTYNPKENSWRVSAGVGSFGYGELNLIKNTVFEHHNLSFGASRLQSDNDYSFLVPQTFNDSTISANQPLRNNDFEKNALFVNNETQLGQHQIRLNVQYSDQTKAIANYQNNTPENRSRLETDTIRYSYQHNWQTAIEWMPQLEWELYRQDKDEQYFDEPGGPINTLWDYDTNKQNVAVRPYFTLAAFTITPFADFSRQEFISTSTTNGQPTSCNGIGLCDISAVQKQLNFGSRFEWQPQSNPLSAYLLLSQLQEKNTNIAINNPNAERLNVDKDYGTQELGLSYHLNHNNGAFKAFSSYSNGVRTPTLFELFGDRGSFKGNDDLLPEEAKTISLGAEQRGKNYSITSSIYHQKLDNSIVAIFNSDNVGSYQNVSSATVKGFELQGHYQFSSALSVMLQSNIISSSNESVFVAFDDKKLPGIYHQQYSVAVEYQFNPSWRVNLKTSVDRELYFNRTNTFADADNIGNGNPANRVTTDLYLNWQRNAFNVSLAFNNLFDEDYQDLANRPAQGRSIQLKLSIEDL
ncbi:MAG: vitamin B12 transporter [Phenylobacterium sp.]|jgi:vitamin B12 transporter